MPDRQRSPKEGQPLVAEKRIVQAEWQVM